LVVWTLTPIFVASTYDFTLDRAGTMSCYGHEHETSFLGVLLFFSIFFFFDDIYPAWGW
jgi:hypothetical protein